MALPTALRHAFRKLVRDPGLTFTAVLALTLGIGLTTMMFSVVYGAFYRGLPFDEPEELVRVATTDPSHRMPPGYMRIHDYVDWRAEQRSFEDLAAYDRRAVNVAGTEAPQRVAAAYITASAFPLVGAAPALGRLFRPAEMERGAEPVALLSHALWRDRYHADPHIVGRVIRVQGQPTTIIGVMPEGFHFPMNEDMWLPMAIDPTAYPRGRGPILDVFGRLRDGMTEARARADLQAIAQRLALEYPETNAGVVPVLEPFGDRYMSRDTKAGGLTMFGAVILVLLIACANVANLVLARAIARSREVGVRTALGARRSWIIGHFLTETLALAVVGAALGLGLAAFGLDWLNRTIADKGPPYWVDIRLDGVSLLFVVAAVLVATLLSGALPAWQASRASVVDLLKEQARGMSAFRLGRLSRVLVVLEIALSCGLLVGAGLATRSVLRLNTVSAAYARDSIFVARLSLPLAKYPDEASRERFRELLLPRLRSLPGAREVGLTTMLPGSWAGFGPVALDGVTYDRPEDRPRVRQVDVTPGFFEALDVEPRAGRLLEAGDRAGALPVAVVNESFVRRHVPDGDAVGTRLMFDNEDGWVTVVGVVPDMHAGGLGGSFQEAVYRPLAQARWPAGFEIAIRTAGPPASLTRAVREAVASLDPDLPLFNVGSMADRLDRMYWEYPLFSTLFTSFGLAALLLASIGLYAVMSFSTRSRTAEIGIRMALGANARRVLGMVLRQGATQLGIGLLLGLAMATGLAHLLTSFLFGIDPRDPATFAGVVVVLATVGLAATLVPGWRATRVDPVEALRAE